MLSPEPQPVIISQLVWKFIIALLLGGNTGLLGFLLRFTYKHYRKYKNAIMVGIEEHEKLVEDYIQRHPEERFNRFDYLDQFTKGRRISRSTEVRSTDKFKRSDKQVEPGPDE
jgi:uncharacterized short protein YbdD (DUF466 family)